MTILVTGATGRVGQQIVEQLLQRNMDVRVLTRSPSKVSFSKMVEVVKGDLLNIDSLREAMTGIRTLFLLNAVTGDEFTQALITLNIAKEVGVDRVVYLSVFDAEKAVNVPHFTVKYGAERMLKEQGFSATILRPAYFIDNDVRVKEVIFNNEVYPIPIGGKGIAMIDVTDIAEIAALELIRRDQAETTLPVETLNLVGPDTLSGTDIAAIWSEELGKTIKYGGDDPSGFESYMETIMPKWSAYEMRLMAERYVGYGMIPQAGDTEHLTKLLGRPLKSYRDFVKNLINNERVIFEDRL
ncbi:NmrA family NAD(P)-binding protein [Vibrio sp.]|uniref:SDR family oxidoreductase n=1 Tax=Celerinatantimonas sp. MCCC 1A17872 TaxID=3177514 RepID=UPI00233AD5F5|nr:NmrA family NAD(P)-binding protein [Vibrio sp.]